MTSWHETPRKSTVFRLAALLLLENGADANLASRNSQMVAPLHSAASSDSIEMVRLFLRYGADCSSPNDAGQMPKDVPNRKNIPEIDRLLSTCGDEGAA